MGIGYVEGWIIHTHPETQVHHTRGTITVLVSNIFTAALAQWVVKTRSDSSTSKRSTIGVSVAGPLR